MSTVIPRFPLQWPTGWKRTPPSARVSARFGKKVTKTSSYTPPGGQASTYQANAGLTIADGVNRVRDQLHMLGVTDDYLVISSNLKLRLDGLPRSDQGNPADPGVAVYWIDRRNTSDPPKCMAIDKYDRVADNLAAVAATLDALRAIERHGGATIVERAFVGVAALPEPESVQWRDVLDPSDPEGSYRRLRSQHHPDRGGKAEEFQRVQRAFDAYRQEQANGR